MKRINKVLIGKNVSYDATAINVNGVSDTYTAGDIYILDKHKQLLAPGSTITDSDIIYIAQATADTFTDVNGLTHNELIYSAPIEGSKVVSYKGKAYAAASAKVATLAATGVTPVVGDEYVLRFVYLDFQSETPAQYVHEYRTFATSTTLSDLYDAFRTLIANDIQSITSAGARVTATGTTTLILTAKAIPFVVGNIDPYKTVEFVVLFNHILPGTSIPETAGPVVTYTGGLTGSGIWQEVHDLEKAAKFYEGPTNPTWFPVPSRVNTWFVDSAATYDYITIDSNLTYASPDNNYDKEAKLNTTIALYHGAAQNASILAILNPWMASTPKAFTTVAL